MYAKNAGATPNETTSASESYSLPKREVERASRATRPSRASHRPASTIPSAARSKWPWVDWIIERKPKNRFAVVKSCGRR